MPLLKSIKDKQSTKRNKADKEDQRLLSASARNAKEKEFFEQKKKREAERKAAQERIKKAQSAIASRNSSAGVGSSVNSGKGNSPVTRAAMNAPSGSDDVNRAGAGGHNRANDNKGNQPKSGNLGGGGSSSFSAMLAALAEENERRSGTGGHNIAGESDSRGQRFSDSAQRRSAIPASSLSNELGFSDDDKNKSWSQMVDDLQSQRRKPDTKDNTIGKEDTRTYNPWDDILWREEQDAMVYEDMKNGWKPNGDVIGAGHRAYAKDVMSEWDEFTGGQYPIPDLTTYHNFKVYKGAEEISPIKARGKKYLPSAVTGAALGTPFGLIGPLAGGIASTVITLLGPEIDKTINPTLISAGPAKTMEISVYDSDQDVTIYYTATKYAENGMDVRVTYKAHGSDKGYFSNSIYPYNTFN